MNYVQCERNHFYDVDKFKEGCPFCAAAGDQSKTVSFDDIVTQGSDTFSKTEPIMGNSGNNSMKPLSEALEEIMPSSQIQDDMGKTISHYSKSMGAEPVVGWLIGLTGEVFGESFALKSGKNFIGRGMEMDVVLKGDNTVSKSKHAIVIYEPKSRTFIAQSGESKELFYINDKVVLNNEPIQKNDILNIGDTKLMLIPCCDENFCWEDFADEK